MSSTSSRWLSLNQQTQELPPETVQQRPILPPTGATRPQLSVTEPDHVDKLPQRTVQGAKVAYWFLGVHGGAGESSLSALDSSCKASDHEWPIAPEGTCVVLVARSNMAGLRAAQKAAIEWASGSLPGVRVAGLVVVADAPGKLPKEIRDFMHVISGGVPQLWTIPWMEQWRLGHELPLEQLPKPVRTVIEQIRLTTNTQPAT